MLFDEQNRHSLDLSSLHHFYRMQGQGKYTFPSGTIYTGGMLDGMFHGDGELLFTNGNKYKGTWNRGISVDVSRKH